MGAGLRGFLVSESARDEALRLLHEAGFEQLADKDDDPMCSDPREAWIGSTYRTERLIALARQRSGWVWVPEKGSDAIFAAGMSYDSRFTRLLVEAMWKSMLAAAPKPEEGE
jgi:hypothetical protein